MYYDYLQESNNDYDMWIHNHDWKVLPTIYFVDGYPCVLTCKYHDGVYVIWYRFIVVDG